MTKATAPPERTAIHTTRWLRIEVIAFPFFIDEQLVQQIYRSITEARHNNHTPIPGLGANVAMFTGRSAMHSAGRQLLLGLIAAGVAFGICRLIGVSARGN